MVSLFWLYAVNYTWFKYSLHCTMLYSKFCAVSLFTALCSVQATVSPITQHCALHMVQLYYYLVLNSRTEYVVQLSWLHSAAHNIWCSYPDHAALCTVQYVVQLSWLYSIVYTRNMWCSYPDKTAMYIQCALYVVKLSWPHITVQFRWRSYPNYRALYSIFCAVCLITEHYTEYVAWLCSAVLYTVETVYMWGGIYEQCGLVIGL